MPEILRPHDLFVKHPAAVLFLAYAKMGDCQTEVMRRARIGDGPAVKATRLLREKGLIEFAPPGPGSGCPRRITKIDPKAARSARRAVFHLGEMARHLNGHFRMDGGRKP